MSPKDTIEKNTFFKFLVKYIGIPFIYLYFFILYAYTAKVLMNLSEWPKGQIPWMVIGFSIFGYKIYAFSEALTKDNPLILGFRKYFPFAVFPQIGMLAYAITLRVGQYDITMNRYFVVVFGIWLAGISLYYGISRQKYLAILPASLAAMIILISV